MPQGAGRLGSPVAQEFNEDRRLAPFSGMEGDVFPEILVVILPLGTESLNVVAIQSLQPSAPKIMSLFFSFQHIIEEHLNVTHLFLGNEKGSPLPKGFDRMLGAERMGRDHHGDHVLFYGEFQKFVAVYPHDVQNGYIEGLGLELLRIALWPVQRSMLLSRGTWKADLRERSAHQAHRQR